MFLNQAWEHVGHVSVDASFEARLFEFFLDSCDSLEVSRNFFSFFFILDFAIMMYSCVEAVYERTYDHKEKGETDSDHEMIYRFDIEGLRRLYILHGF